MVVSERISLVFKRMCEIFPLKAGQADLKRGTVVLWAAVFIKIGSKLRLLQVNFPVSMA